MSLALVSNTLKNFTSSGSPITTAISTQSWGPGCYGHTTSSGSFTCAIATCPLPCVAANTTLSSNGACYDQWERYWDATLKVDPSCTTDLITYCSTVSPATITLTDFESTELSGVEGTEYWTDTWTNVISDGAFPIATVTVTDSGEYTEQSTRVTKTILRTTAIMHTSLSYPLKYDSIVHRAFPTPNCTLPSVIPQCQSSWSNFVTSTPTTSGVGPAWAQGYYGDALVAFDRWPQPQRWGPNCSVASIDSSLCSSIHGQWSSLIGSGAIQSNGFRVVTTESAFSAKPTVTSYWPSNFTFAPGCTLGCSACHITGGSVQLLYWPEATASPNISAKATDTPVTAVYQNVTLTSPTNYIAFSKLYASDSCSGIGTTYPSTIIPISRSADLSSLYGYDWKNTLHLYTASFKVADFKEPVPNSIYNSQPYCAESLTQFFNLYESGDNYIPANTANFTCSRIGPYRPIISIPPEVRALDPAWAQCDGAIEGIYDPPIALTQADAPAQLTISGQHTTASPQGSPTSGGSPQTSAPSAEPDSLETSPGLGTPSHTSQTASETSVNAADPARPTTNNAGTSGENPAGPISKSTTNTAGGVGGDPADPTSKPATGSTGANGADPADPASKTATDTTSGNGDTGQTTTPNLVSMIMSAIGGQITTGNTSPESINGNPSPSSTDADATPIVGTIGGQTIIADPSNSNAIVLGGSQTIEANGPAATVDGQTLSYDSSHGIIVQSDGHHSTLTFSGSSGDGDATGVASTEALITAGSGLMTVKPVSGSNGIFSIDGTTIAAGGPALTADGETISAESNGVVVMSGSHIVETRILLPASTLSASQPGSSGSGLTLGPNTAGADGGKRGILQIWTTFFAIGIIMHLVV